MSLKVETTVYKSTGLICTEVKNETGLLVKRVIDTQEEQLRQALIALGWTPPPEKSV